MKNLLLAVSLLLFVGCSWNGLLPQSDPSQNKDIVIQKVDKDDLRNVLRQEKMIYGTTPSDISLSATGEGLAPLNSTSYAQSVAMAKRAAMADAYAQLAGKLYGVKIDAQDTVKDAMLKSSTINTRVQGLVKNARIISEGFEGGMYRVNMELRIDQAKWDAVFSY